MAKTEEFGFKVIVQAIMEHKEGSRTSTSKRVEIMLEPSPNLDREKYLINDGESGPTQIGTEAITAVLVQGLVANIHQGHQAGTLDSAAHLRKIISSLEDGFVANADSILGRNFTDLNTINGNG